MISTAKMVELFEVIREALIITDEAGIIQAANKKARSILVMEKSDLKGRHIHALLTPRQGQIHLGEISHEEVYGLIMWRLTRNEELKEDLNSSSGTFLAAMTHEIRTPMNGIVGMTELALEERMSPVLKEYLEVIRLSADSLMRVINDILDYSKIEAGKLNLEDITFSFHSFMDDIIRIFSPQVKAKGLEFRYNPSPDIPDKMEGDPVRIRQIILNLLSNALKFTKKGFIEISTYVDLHSHPQRVYFHVADSGIGIPLNKQHLLFRSFTQVDSSTTRKYGGTGLGLAICAHLTSSMGGMIDVKSRAGQGSTFRFYLPLKRTEPIQSELIPVPHPDELKLEKLKHPRAEGPVVLLMEDNRVNQLLAVRTMEKAGYQVVTAENGKEGLKEFTRERPDIILMDIQMPVLDGYDTARAIRKLEGQTKTPVPIIALTALALTEDREKILDAGIDDFLGKPVSPIDLKKILHKYVMA